MMEITVGSVADLVAIAQVEIDRDRGRNTLLRAWTMTVEVQGLTEWNAVNQAMTRLANATGFENRSHHLWHHEEVEEYIIYLFNPQSSL